MLRSRCVLGDLTNTPQATERTSPDASGLHLKGSISMPMPLASMRGRHASLSTSTATIGAPGSALRGRLTPSSDTKAITGPAKLAQLQVSHSAVKRQPSQGVVRAIGFSPLKAVPVGPAKSGSARTRTGTAPPKLQMKHLMPGTSTATAVARYMERGTPRDVLRKVVQEHWAGQPGSEATDSQQERPVAQARYKHTGPLTTPRLAPECTPEPECGGEQKGADSNLPGSVLYHPRVMGEDAENQTAGEVQALTQQPLGSSRRRLTRQQDDGLSGKKMSSVAAYFEASRKRSSRHNSEEEIDVVLGDLVDSVLLACHCESQRNLPTEVDLHARLSSAQRESILIWLVQACDIMRFHEAVLYSTVLTLDRYCAAAREPLPMDRMQKVLMAVICTVLKTCAVADEVCMPLRDLLVHLCRRQVQFEDILMMEHQVLRTLQFRVSATSPLDFLDALCVPLLAGEPAEGSPGRCLANFLLQLSLFNAPLHYRRAHAILAAAALYVALCTLQMAPALVVALLKDVTMTCSEIMDVCNQVGACAAELHAMWIDFASVQGTKVPCLLRKFASRHLHEALLLNPPPNSLPHPAAFATFAWQVPPGLSGSPRSACKGF
mmetsp:Transcript_25527/g.48284  ORF Transcript_25527/g.48284 Transcript_25527/m.48284 type:complete len:606 (+) Transcript_25527:138-1955(+)